MLYAIIFSKALEVDSVILNHVFLYSSCYTSLLLFALASVLELAVFQTTVRRMLCQRLALYVFVGGAFVISAVVLLFAPHSALLLTAAVAWVGVIAALFLKVRAIIAFLAPLATLILLLHLLFSTGSLPAIGTSSIMLNLHILLAICGEAFAIGACALAVLYLWQRHILKKKLLKWIGIEMPALDRIGRLLLFCLWVGFVFLTVALLTGAVYSQLHSHVLNESIKLKITWALAVWGWYLAILIGNKMRTNSPRHVARMSLGGFVLLALAFFGLLWQ